MEDARSSSCWVGLKILKARGDQQRQFGQTDLPLAALLGWARCSWEHKGCAVPVLEPAAAVGGCVRAAEALRKHSYSQPMALGRTCPWLAALGLRELCWVAANVLCQQPQLLGASSCVQGLGTLCSCWFSLTASWV